MHSVATSAEAKAVPVNSVVALEAHGDIRIVRIDSPPVNALSQPVRAGIAQGVAAAIAAGASAVVIACSGRTFCAGADISEFGRAMLAPDLNDVLAAIESAPVPIVAALHGTALGGGLELALACHHRVAAPSARIGLPEVSLGLLPGAGGTQRAPRLAGVEAALDLIVGGKPIGAARAQQLGLVDAVAGETTLVSDAIAAARQLAASDAPLRRARDLPVDLSPEAARAAIAAYRQRNPRSFIGFKAPDNIVRAVQAAAELPFDAGLARERELFDELMASDESAAQRHLFFAERAAAKVPGLAPETKAMPLERAGVVGAGTMGMGITLALLGAGFSVTLVDRSPEALEAAAARIVRTVRGLAEKGRLTPEAAEREIAALSTAAQVQSLASADLIVEAVFERLDLKQQVFAEIDAVARPGAVIASNTSFLDLDAIASATTRPESVVGLHFFAPANIMRLLEVVRGARTSDSVLATAMALGRRLGKVAVMSGVCDGFIANRVMARRGEAAERLVLQGAMPWDVDRAMTGYGFPMGVFQMLDLVGLDVIGWDRENSAGCSVQEILCEAGHWGQKTGSGYYDYSGTDPVPAASAIEAIETIRARSGEPQRSFSDAELVVLLLDPVINEGAKLLEEGIALRASDIDMALVTGYGWPVWRGGPMFWGDTVGLTGIVERLTARIAAGEPITLSPLLAERAAAGGAFVRL